LTVFGWRNYKGCDGFSLECLQGYLSGILGEAKGGKGVRIQMLALTIWDSGISKILNSFTRSFIVTEIQKKLL
jgi:hypothetical protein